MPKAPKARGARSGHSPAQRRLLARTRPLADGIAALLFPFAEVVIHDLESQTIVHIVNPLSRREVGDATALDDIDFDVSETVIGPYEKRNWDGSRMRAISVLVREDDGRPAGVVCVNLTISAFEQARQTLELFVRGVQVVPQPEKLFRDDWQERILSFLHPWLQERQLTLGSLTREQKRELVVALHRHGAFEGRGTADYVARLLDMGRATVFKHLKSIRGRGR
jgi:predicted transcriptional regulator YheO